MTDTTTPRMACSLLMVVLLTLGLAPSAQARHFKVYGYSTLDPGEWELVYWTDYVARSQRTMDYFGQTGVARQGLWSHTLEAEVGITDRFMVAAYFDFEQPPGEAFKYVQTRIVAARYRFGEPGEHFFDTAIYLEYYLPEVHYQNRPREKLETRLILERQLARSTLRINANFEKITSGPDIDEGLEFGYGISLYTPWSDRLSLGLEYYGGLGELAHVNPAAQKHYLVPALTWRFSKSLKWNVGVAAGLTDASDDVVVKSLLEWEL